MGESTDRTLTTMTYLAEARRLAGNGTREGAVIAMLLAYIEAQDAIFKMRDRRPATATEIADGLRAVAEELHEVASEAVNRWGYRLQLGMVIEEAAELTKAVAKVLRHETDPADTTSQLIDDLAEEAADMEIMLAQVRCMIDSRLIERHKRQKLERLRARVRRGRRE